MSNNDTNVRENVREYYAKRAIDSSCCSTDTKLYPVELTDNIPADITEFSMGCGNPITLAEIQPGETILDLGSGGGLDCFLAAQKTGSRGKVIGIDMTDEMLERARQKALELGFSNVEFKKGYLEKIPVDGSSIDVVISNCVINLSPDKSKVFSEIFRGLKPGGRIAISDIVSKGEIPQEILAMKDSWSSCMAGALSIEEFNSGLLAAGFGDIHIEAVDSNQQLTSNLPHSGLFSAAIRAIKPA